jgi:hypothetical protein
VRITSASRDFSSNKCRWVGTTRTGCSRHTLFIYAVPASTTAVDRVKATDTLQLPEPSSTQHTQPLPRAQPRILKKPANMNGISRSACLRKHCVQTTARHPGAVKRSQQKTPNHKQVLKKRGMYLVKPFIRRMVAGDPAVTCQQFPPPCHHIPSHSADLRPCSWSRSFMCDIIPYTRFASGYAAMWA